MATAALHPVSHDTLITGKPDMPVSGKPRHVQSELTFNKPREDGTPHPAIYIGKPETYERPMVTIPVTIHDVSGHELDYTLDSHGFQFHYHESKQKEFLDDDVIREHYYPEVEQLLKDVTGASRFFIFDHIVRRAPKDWVSGNQPRGPIHTVHIDASYFGAEARVRYHFPDEAPKLLKGRYLMISVWRPIRTILKDPLAVSDSKSAPDSSLEELKFIYPASEGGREGGSWSVKPDPNIKWYYRYKQPPSMVTFIKLFDSKNDGRAKRVPHSSFVDPEKQDAPARESIEVRVLVFHPEDRD